MAAYKKKDIHDMFLFGTEVGYSVVMKTLKGLGYHIRPKDSRKALEAIKEYARKARAQKEPTRAELRRDARAAC